jgi:hypothetical protein
MTCTRLNEIQDLINKLDFKLIQLQSVVTVASGNGFLDHSKAILAPYLSIIEEKVLEIVELNDRIFDSLE